MPHLVPVNDGYEVVYERRVEDLEIPRNVVVSWRDASTGELKSRQIRKKVGWVVMDDAGLFTFYDSDGNEIEEFLDWNADVKALVPGFNSDRTLRYAS